MQVALRIEIDRLRFGAPRALFYLDSDKYAGYKSEYIGGVSLNPHNPAPPEEIALAVLAQKLSKLFDDD